MELRRKGIKLIAIILVLSISLNTFATTVFEEFSAVAKENNNILEQYNEQVKETLKERLEQAGDQAPEDLIANLSLEELRLLDEMIETGEIETYMVIDPVSLKVAIDGAMALLGIFCTWSATTTIVNNRRNRALEEPKFFLYQQFDEASRIFQTLPPKTKAYCSLMVSDYSQEELMEAYPGLTPTEYAQVTKTISSGMLNKLRADTLGIYDAFKIFMGNYYFTTPLEIKPRAEAIDFYRNFNLNHKYGTGMRIPSSINPFFPEGQPYGVSYSAQLKAYNYGWEYVDFYVRYAIPKTTGSDNLYIELYYLTKLSPNQQYDGRLYSYVEQSAYGSQSIKVSVYDSSTKYLTDVAYGKYDDGTKIGGSVPSKVRALVSEHCGFDPIVDDTLWHSWIDFAPMPENLTLTKAYQLQHVYAYNGFEFPIRPAITPIYNANFTRAKLKDGSFLEPLKEDAVPITVEYDEEIELAPTIDIPYEPLPNPFDEAFPELPTDPSPSPEVPGLNIPSGFFDSILSFFDKIWYWLNSFFEKLWSGLKALFIPSEGFFDDLFNDSRDDIIGALGYLNMNMLEDNLASLTENEPIITVELYGQRIKVIDFSYWKQYKEYLHGLINGVFGILLVLYNLRMIQWLIRASDQFYQSQTIGSTSSSKAASSPPRATKGGRFL